MACTLYMAWDERLTGYDFGPSHPLAPVRVELTIALARAFGLLGEPGVTVEQPVPATDAELELVHDPRYIEAVRRAGRDGARRDGARRDAAGGNAARRATVRKADAERAAAGCVVAPVRARHPG